MKFVNKNFTINNHNAQTGKTLQRQQQETLQETE